MNPGNIAVMNNLANTYKNLDQIDLAEELYIKIINKKPDYINAYVNYGNLKRDMNDFTKALELYGKALKINEKIPSNWPDSIGGKYKNSKFPRSRPLRPKLH